MEEATAPQPKKKRGCLFWVLVAVGILFGLSVLGAIVDPKPRSNDAGGTAPGQPPVAAAAIDPDRQVTSQQLAGGYSENEVATQQWANAGPIEVTGTIEAIELDFMDNPTIRLPGATDFSWVTAYFDDDAASQISALKKGNSITLVCNKVSEVIGNPQLNECVIKQ